MHPPYFIDRWKFKRTKNASTLLYEFPIASVTNYHTCDGLKESTFIILPLWRSEI